MRCPFCETSVVVPEELRPDKAQSFEPINVVLSNVEIPTGRSKGGTRWWVFFGIVIVLFIVGVTVIPIILTQMAVSSANNAIQSAMTEIPAIAVQPTDVPTLAPSPTPAYAQAVMHFGSKGIGPGMLNDARYIAIDGNGIIYVADYEGGRIQAFDMTGKYLSQWKVGDSNTDIQGLSANQKGDVFVSFDGSISEFEGATGNFLMKLTDPNGGEFGDLSSTADGNLAGVWYQARWGVITSLDGHRDDLVVFNSRGKIIMTIPSFISGQTGDLALDTDLAIDGLGNIYALSTEDGVIFKFTPDGKYINRFGSQGDQPGQFSFPSAIAIDGQGRIFVSDEDKIDIFSSDGRFLTSFPTDSVVNMMAFDQKGALWAVSGDTITKYVVSGN